MSAAVQTFVSSITGPLALAFDTNGNLYCSTSNDIIYKITTGGSVSTFASGLSGPTGLAFDSSGFLYCSNQVGSTISKISTTGTVTTFVNSGLSNPNGLAFDTNGFLYCANNGNNTISKISSVGTVSTFVSSGLSGPISLAFDTSGFLYCLNQSSNIISKISTSGTVTTFTTASTASFPVSLVFDSSGFLYLSDTFNNAILKISTSATISTFISSGLNRPKGLAINSSGFLYIANGSGNNILKTTNSLDPVPVQYPCFKEGSKILTDKGYINIEHLQKGDLVKTIKDGFKRITMIGKREIYHAASNERIKDQLYQCSSNEYPEIFEPLVITGCHCILVDNFKNYPYYKEKMIALSGDIFVTDNKYRLPACIDEKTTVYENAGTYLIYHFALEHYDKLMNYGIYANGLIVETCSERNLKEYSGMELLE